MAKSAAKQRSYRAALKAGLTAPAGGAALANPQNLAVDYNNGIMNVGDYDGNGNPELIAWQNMSDSDVGHFLHTISDDQSLLQQQSNDKWAYHDSEFQKFVNKLGLHDAPTVLNDSDFKKYCQATGQTAMYRGWSGTSAADRYSQSPNSHVGNGINGDGYYITTPGDISTARGYAGPGNTITKFAFSPTARIVSVNDVRNEIAKQSRKTQKALKKAGGGRNRTYGSNQGEAQMALKMGYNVIDAGWAFVVLTRDATVVSSKTVH